MRWIDLTEDASRDNLETKPQISQLCRPPGSLPMSDYSSDQQVWSRDGSATMLADGNASDTVESTWGVSKTTLALLVGFYLAALLIACGHWLVFAKLNGTSVDSLFISQGYVTTLSTALSTLWTLSLGACLGTAFTQCIWKTVRNKFISISTLDKLFDLLQNIFSIRWDGLRASPTLYGIAVLYWSLSILATLPPGAMTVIPAPFITYNNISIPVYNSSYIGNGSFASLTEGGMPGNITIERPLGNYSSHGFEIYYDDPTDFTPLQRLLQSFLLTRNVPSFQSPCGANCSYSYSFEGPHLDCHTERSNITTNSTVFPPDSDSPGVGEVIYDGFIGQNNSTTLLIHQIKSLLISASSNVTKNLGTHAIAEDLICKMSAAEYTANVSFKDGIPTTSYTAQRLRPLQYNSSCDIGPFWARCYVNGTVGNKGYSDADWKGVLDLPQESRLLMKDLSIYSLVQKLTSVFNGNLTRCCVESLPKKTGGQMWYNGCDGVYFYSTMPPIVNTFFSDNQYYDSPKVDFAATISITPELLNEALFNITTTFANSDSNYFRQQVVSKRTTYLPTYSFSQPLNLLLPYFIPLIISSVIVLYTIYTITYTCPLSAMGGFTQILMTTAGSKKVSEVAIGGCLGGNDNIPAQLKSLRVRFGDVTSPSGDGSGEMVRQAAFGVEGEVSPLTVGKRYGATQGFVK